MKFEHREILLKDGRICVLCPTYPEYAADMIEYLTELAKELGFEQIDLEVVDGNDNAKHLYEKCGFVESGKRIRALKYDNGTYRDEIIMSKIL